MARPPNRATASAAITPVCSLATGPGAPPGGVAAGGSSGPGVGGWLLAGDDGSIEGGGDPGGAGRDVGVVGEVGRPGAAEAGWLALGGLDGLGVRVGPGVTSGTTVVVKFAQRYSRWVSPEARICAASSRPT